MSTDKSLYVGHQSFARVPNGGGDSLAALFLAHRLSGKTPAQAQQLAVSSIFDILSTAQKDNHKELPLALHQDSFLLPPLLDIQDIKI